MRHHYQGPGRAKPTSLGYRYKVHVEPEAPRGTKRRIASVLHDSRSWLACGVKVTLAAMREEADCIVAVRTGGELSLNAAGYDCGHAEAGLSCCHTVNGKAYITFVQTHLFSNPELPARVVNHEFAHAVFRACDMFDDLWYTGIMGRGANGTSWPTDDDVGDCIAWLRGEASEIGC